MHTHVLVVGLLIAACATSFAAVLPPDKPSMAVKVEAGEYSAMGRKVKVAQTVEVAVEPVDMVSVKDEWHVLGDEKPRAYIGGTGLNKTYGPVDIYTRLPYAIAPETVKVHSEAGGGTVYTEGKDYELDHDWGGVCRIPTGSIPEKTKMFFDYSVYLERVDVVQVAKDGKVSVKKGTPAPVCPAIPEADKDCTAIANIYIPYRTSAITTENIYPLPGKKAKWQDYIKVSGRDNIKHTLHEMEVGMPVTIVCWGDSVTAGGSASKPENRYVDRLRAYLKEAYPKSDITVINAGIGGTNTDSRREGFEREVMSLNPDLITVEFVNDCGMSAEKIKQNWDEFVAKARSKKATVEFVFITPHHVMASWMGGHKTSVPAMREAAVRNRAGLADAANIWENLRGLGIPYQTLEANGINHPDDLGHEFFAACLQKLMEPEQRR